ncbi:MAG: putative sulfate exporter family transporter [Porticoccaceae bacterium]|nr:putative sulfate exporter family transporter [Porticoccaceae bacterium]
MKALSPIKNPVEVPLIRGVFICVIVALAASFIANHYGGPVMLFALLLGMAVNFLATDKASAAGIDFSANVILKTGVALLGGRILFEDISSLGLLGVAVVVASTLVTIVFGALLARLLKVPTNLGLLSGGAVAICGVSATMTLSTVMPKNEQTERYIGLTVVMVSVIGSVAMISYPILLQQLPLNTAATGFILGASIHDVSHVAGASFSISAEVGHSAMVVKMLRVAMLIPIAWMFFWHFRHPVSGTDNSATAGRSGLRLPLFLIVFVVLCCVNNFGWIPQPVAAGMEVVSQWCFVIAIVALGIKTSFQGLAGIGWRPVLLVMLQSLFLGFLAVLWALYSY